MARAQKSLLEQVAAGERDLDEASVRNAQLICALRLFYFVLLLLYLLLLLYTVLINFYFFTFIIVIIIIIIIVVMLSIVLIDYEFLDEAEHASRESKAAKEAIVKLKQVSTT